MVLAYIIVLSQQLFVQKMLSLLKKKTEWRASQIDFKWFQEQKVLGGWVDFFKSLLWIKQDLKIRKI